MNKKLLILGVSALAVGFFSLTSFDGKTREQQMAEIEQMATMKLDELRTEKETECTDRVNTEAQRRFDEIVAQRAADAAAKPGKKPGKKPSGGKGTVDPLPQPTPPPTSRDRGDATDPAKKKERGDVTDPAKKRERGDTQQKAGGGK